MWFLSEANGKSFISSWEKTSRAAGAFQTLRSSPRVNRQEAKSRDKLAKEAQTKSDLVNQPRRIQIEYRRQRLEHKGPPIPNVKCIGTICRTLATKEAFRE
ncbi:hypothetical protein RUM43_002843 [Polyplax serrata]|uniref:Uncharacterized protein n=1 Tax=Polyplax serrata TaxID=468196 RepID=A0AAN8NZW3_POLSC